MKIVLITGGFDPIHSGHINYIKEAKQLGDILVVGVNSDAWLTRKKGRPFMPLRERAAILRAMTGVDFVIDFRDDDGTACHAIEMVRASYPQDRIIFANGGDRTSDNIPEMQIQDTNIEFVFGVGGQDKRNSSSWILNEWKSPQTGRPWGYYRVIHQDGHSVKVKELVVDAGMCLSMQRHQHRSEHWFVARGEATVYTMVNHEIERQGHYRQFEHLHIPSEQWHRLCNEGVEPLHIVEIQYGVRCEEEDIERQ